MIGVATRKKMMAHHAQNKQINQHSEDYPKKILIFICLSHLGPRVSA
jgi:hypothetical protein